MTILKQNSLSSEKFKKKKKYFHQNALGDVTNIIACLKDYNLGEKQVLEEGEEEEKKSFTTKTCSSSYSAMNGLLR